MNELSTIDVSGANHHNKFDRNILLAAKGSFIVFAGALFGYGSQLVIGIMLARILGAEKFGQYRVTVNTGEIVSGFALLGMDYAMVRFVSFFVSRHDTEGLRGTLQAGLGLTLFSSLIIGIGLFALANPLALHLFHDPSLVPLLRLVSLLVPFLNLSRVLASATKGFNKMQYATVAQQIVQPLIRLLLLGLLGLLGLTTGKAVITYIAGLIATCVLLLYFLDRLFPLKDPLKTAKRDTKALLSFSLPVYLATLLDRFGPNLQTVLIGSLNTLATVGIFGAAAQVSMACSMFNSSIGTASDPIISELHIQQDRTQMAHFYQTTTKWMFMVNLPFFLILLILSRPILAIFGNEFIDGSTAMIILALANLIIAAAGISDGILAMTGNTSVKLANSAIQAIFSIGLCFILIPHWGAVGAASSALITAFVVNLLRVLEVLILYQMIPYSLSFLKPAIAGLVAMAIGWLTRLLLHTETNLIIAALNAFAILVGYVGMILLLGVSAEDQAVFTQLRSRFKIALSKS